MSSRMRVTGAPSTTVFGAEAMASDETPNWRALSLIHLHPHHPRRFVPVEHAVGEPVIRGQRAREQVRQGADLLDVQERLTGY